VVGTDAFVGVPNVGVLVAVVALPGFLLTGTYALATTDSVLAATRAFASTLLISWAPWGVAGYATGLASTVVESVLDR
jgi:hypothetical protein